MLNVSLHMLNFFFFYRFLMIVKLILMFVLSDLLNMRLGSTVIEISIFLLMPVIFSRD